MPRLPAFLSKLGAARRNPRVLVPTATAGTVIVLGGGGWFLFRSWLLALVVALIVVLVVLVVLLLRTIFSQEREERLKRGTGARERDAPRGTPREPARGAGRESLEEEFRRALEEIRNSRLGSEGIHALPWLLVIGERGAGKSEALRRSGLDLPPEYGRTREAAPTQDCEFWLTNQAVVLDTSGRYLEETPASAKEWRELLGLLARSRPKEPLNGILLAVPATSLLTRGGDELEAHAHTLRRRINELTDALGFDVPIYILVTKVDLVEGFSDVVRALGRGRAGEAFGWTNDRRTFADAGEIALRGLGPVRERLEQLVPEMVLREPEPVRRRRIFLFPREFEQLCQSLAGFLRSAFAPSIYDEMPFLRGVYFTSARREGVAVSSVLRRLGHEWAASELDSEPEGDLGLFLHDVFRELVVGDRELALPANWMGQRTRRWIVGTAAVASLALAVAWGVSFVRHLLAVRRLATESAAVAAGPSDLPTLDRLRGAVVREDAERLPLRGLGLGGNLDRALERSQHTFTWAFGREFEQPTKTRLLGKVRSSDEDAFEGLATLALDVAWLGARAREEEAPRPALAAFSPVGRNEADVAAFRDGYDAFLRWIPDDQVESRIEAERSEVAKAAGRLLDLRLLDAWSARHASELPPVRYADVGLPVPPDGPTTEVTGAYTRPGWESLVRDLVQAVERTGGASRQAVLQFREGYVSRYDSGWREFLVDVPSDPLPLAEAKKSPYLALLAQIDTNMGADLPRADGVEPAWASTLRKVRRDTPMEGDEQPPWPRYLAALEQIEADVAATENRGDHALELAVKMSEGQAASFRDGLALVRDLVPAEDDLTAPDPLATEKLREILRLPILNGASSVLELAMAELDTRWRERIAQPFAGPLDPQQLRALYARPGGALSQFLSEAARGFYADGQVTPAIGDRALPLGPGFLGWIRSAEEVQRYLFPEGGGTPQISVRLEGVPSRLMGAPGLYVTRRDLIMTCGPSLESFEYREGSGTRLFTWTPDCQEVALRIWVRGSGPERELQPRREWGGPLALPEFLREARRLGGNRLQWSLEYPAEGVSVVAEYRLQSGEAILAVAHDPPPGSMRD